MGFFEKTLSALAPGWAASRARSRMLLQAYEAATPSRLRKTSREGRSADGALFAAGASLREQARWLDENHDIVIGLLDKLEERIVGAAGIQVEPQPLGGDGRLHEEFAALLSDRWAKWSVRPEVTGMFTRPEMERMMLRSALRDGEVFAQLVRGAAPGVQHSTDVLFSLEMLEADFVPLNVNSAAPGQLIRQGVHVNNWGRATGYQVYTAHPASLLGLGNKLKTISAENMLHVAMRRRLHQTRGVSLLHGVITRLADLQEYETNERVAAKIASALGFYIKRGDAQSADEFSEPGDRPPIPIEPGMIYDDLRPGEDLGMVESNRPNVHMTEFRNGQLRAVAAGTRSGYSSISRAYDGTYSAQRQELVESFEGYSVLQDWFIGQFCRPVYHAWLKMTLANLDVPADVDRDSLFNATYQGPVMPWIDPAKEATAWRGILRGGAGTEAEWIRARGLVPLDVKRQRLREIEFNRQHGLIFDSDAANDLGEITNDPTEPDDDGRTGTSKGNNGRQ